MKAERRVQELEERETYSSKLLSNRTKEVSELEQAVAKLEQDLHVREERWRRADDDRMRTYYQQRLAGADVAGERAVGQGALAAGARSVGAGAGFKTSGTATA